MEAGAASVTRDRLRAVERLAARSLARMAPRFGVTPPPFRIFVHDQLGTLPSQVRRQLHENTAGVALLGRGREGGEIHLILDAARLSPPHDLGTVVEHEVAHLLIDEAAGGARAHVPRWVHEGIAQWLSGAAYLGMSEEDIVFRAVTGNLLPFADLEQSFPRGGVALQVAYAQSFSFTGFLVRDIGLQRLLDVLRARRADESFARSFARVLDRQLIYAELDWVEYLKSGSGAGLRVLLTNCFSLMLVAALPLLVLATRRRWRQDDAVGDSLERQEVEEQEVDDAVEPHGPTP